MSSLAACWPDSAVTSVTEAAHEDPVIGPDEISAIRVDLAAATTTAELLTAGVSQALATCGFERGVVLAVEQGWLTATATQAADDEASDELRRRVLAEPVPLRAGTAETRALLLAEGRRPGPATDESVVRDRLMLRQHTIAAVVADTQAVALLVVDRASNPVRESERRALGVVAHLLGLALERSVLRMRLADLTAELRHLTVSANALTNEALAAPIRLTPAPGFGPLYVDMGDCTASGGEIHDLLTEREQEVAALVAAGRSNREIGETLFLSTDTAKMHVGNLARKLNAANRAEIAARWVALSKASL